MANQLTKNPFGNTADSASVSADEFRRHHAALWSKRADKYHNQAHAGSGVLKPLARHMASLVVPHLQGLDSSQAVDIACGSGEPAMTIAKAVPTCQVVATDLAPGMVEAAQWRAADEGVENLRAEVADAEDLSSFADGTFDVVTCSAGLMLVPDHNKALREWHRISKPGGRMAAAVWAPAGERTQMIMIMRGLAMKLATGVQMKGNPNQLSDAGQLGKDVAAAGFRNVELSEFNVPMEVPGEYLDEAMLQNPMIADFLDQAKANGRDDIYKEALATVKEVAAEQGRQRDDGGLSCPINMAIVVTATA